MATVPTQRKSCSIALDWRRAWKSIVNNVWAFKGSMMIFDFTYTKFHPGTEHEG